MAQGRDDLYYRFTESPLSMARPKTPRTRVNAMHDDGTTKRWVFRADWHGEKDQVTLEADYQQGALIM